MNDNKHKTNIKFNLCIETEEVSSYEEVMVDFYVTIEELHELINYFRKNNIDPQCVFVNELNMNEVSPLVIVRLYRAAYDIAFPKHLDALMWTIEDFYDEVKHFTYTTDIDQYYANQNFNIHSYDRDEEFYSNAIAYERMQSEYSDRFDETVDSLTKKIIKKDIIRFNNFICELI